MPGTYHPYKDGYSVLPGIVKLGTEPVFQVDEHLDEYLAAKRDIFHEPFHTHDIQPEAMRAICQFMHDRLKVEHPRFRPTLDFCEIALQLQEDLLIHRITEDRDWLAASHVSLPNGWRSEEGAGKSFAEIHGSVPGMSLTRQLVRSMLKGSFYRFSWGVVFERELNSHPDRPRAPFRGKVFVKAERQVLVGFPEYGCVLFVIRPYFVEPDLPALTQAISEMTLEQRAYKNIPSQFVEWLNAKGRILAYENSL